MKTKHTPGPWEINKPGPRYSINAGIRHIAMVSCYVRKDGDEDENIANARLIAAAPDLLAALEGLNYYGDAKVFCCCPRKDGVAEDRFHSTACSDARAAIKKARGE